MTTYCGFCGDALTTATVEDWSVPTGFCTEACRDEAEEEADRRRALGPCRYCPQLTTGVTCDRPSCRGKWEDHQDACAERAVQAELARYQP